MKSEKSVDEALGLLSVSDIGLPDTSYFLPWKIEMIYQVEPSLEKTVEMCRANRRKNWYKRLDIYSKLKMIPTNFADGEQEIHV